uniref:Peptidase S1 domain-containing protein n=1 Tax=Glossina morsitans morsitans TaxID=37546 RepID=A0A1B0FMC8_GLOMM
MQLLLNLALITSMFTFNLMHLIEAALYKDDPCFTKSEVGLCKPWAECPTIKNLLESGAYKLKEVENCGYDVKEEIICCPRLKTDVKISDTTDRTGTSIRPTNISVSDNSERAAVRACKKLETRERPAHLTPHILEGVPAALGEFPHMAGIGYSRSIGDDSPPYNVRCGGALISARFVLTAAHCVASRDNVPKAVVLGVVNFNDPEEMSAALQIKIKETHIHDNYTSSTTYNDIALLELEQDVEYSAFVYPSCLHIDENDPSESETLLVTGWGTVNTATRASSDILLKVNLDIKPLASCNEIFAKYGSDRRLTQGVIKTLLCAGDKEAKKDACSGDSGGPLNLVIDDSYRQYRIVGIVSSGFGCGTSIPGLYTRVALFLDYIEKIQQVFKNINTISTYLRIFIIISL